MVGLPLLQPDHGGSLVATQTLARDLGVGVFFRDVERFALELYDQAVERRRELMWHARQCSPSTSMSKSWSHCFAALSRRESARMGPGEAGVPGFRRVYLLDEQRLVRRVPDSVIEAGRSEYALSLDDLDRLRTDPEAGTAVDHGQHMFGVIVRRCPGTSPPGLRQRSSTVTESPASSVSQAKLSTL